MPEDLELLVRGAMAAPTQVPDFEELAERGRRQRVARRVMGGVAGLGLVVAAVAIGAGLLRSPDVPVVDEVPSVAEDARVPAGWQRVLAGGGQFFVPPDWVVDSTTRIDEACELYFSTPPLVLVGPLGRIPSCPMDDVSNPGPGIRAGGADLVEWFFPDSPGEPVAVAGFAAERWVFEDEDHRLEAYRIDELDLFLQMRTDSVPELMAQILATVRPAEPGERDSEFDPESGPGLMEVEPNPARPGEVVDLTFPLETGRGVAFVLEEWTGGEYMPRYYLISEPQHAGSGRWWYDVDDGHPGWDDLGIGGPGPDQVVIPEVAPPGQYRICTGNAGQDFCAPIEIMGE